MQLVPSFTIHFERTDELRWKIRWQKDIKKKQGARCGVGGVSFLLLGSFGSWRHASRDPEVTEAGWLPLWRVTFAPLTARRDDKSSRHTSPAAFGFGQRCGTCHRRPDEWEESKTPGVLGSQGLGTLLQTPLVGGLFCKRWLLKEAVEEL